MTTIVYLVDGHIYHEQFDTPDEAMIWLNEIEEIMSYIVIDGVNHEIADHS